MIVGSFDISPKTTEVEEGSATVQLRVSVGPVAQTLDWPPQVLHRARARGRRGRHPREEMVLGKEASILGQLYIKLDWRPLKGSNFLAHAH